MTRWEIILSITIISSLPEEDVIVSDEKVEKSESVSAATAAAIATEPEVVEPKLEAEEEIEPEPEDEQVEPAWQKADQEEGGGRERRGRT